MTSEVSVIVPTYNRANLILETLKSILDQSYSPAEVIVVDDGSTDNTEATVRQFGSSIKYLRIENSGECRARNIGVSVARSPLVAFCDSDDLWHRDKLQRQIRLFQAAPYVEYSFTNFSILTENGWSKETKFDSSPNGYWVIKRRDLDSDLFVVEEPMTERLLRHQPIFPSTLMMTKRFFEAVGRWNEPLGRTRSVDLEFHLRCVNHQKIGVVSSPVVGIRKHATNFSGDPILTTIGEITVLRYVLEHSPSMVNFTNLIKEEIIRRSASVAKAAFEIGDYEKMRAALQAVPLRNRTLKVHVEALIAHFPKGFGRGLYKIYRNARNSI